MNWLVLSYFLSLGSLSYEGYAFSPVAMAQIVTPPYTFQTTLGVEAQIFDNHLFVGGRVETWESFASAIFFAPFQAFYSFNAGLRWNGFEIGYLHTCSHPIVSMADLSVSQGILGIEDRIYFSYSGKLNIF